MKIPGHIIRTVRGTSGLLPLYRIDSWEPRSDDGDHGHCWSCGHTLYAGDRCMGRYLEYTCVTFCLECVADNEEVVLAWMNPNR